jgi:hypothetical protein
MNQRYYVTPEERRAYGDDLLSVVERKAMEAVQPHLDQLQNANDRLARRVYAQGARTIYDELDEHVPGWREINTSPEFLAWLNNQDVFSGAMKNSLLRQAFGASDAARVRAFFAGYLAEHPEARRGSAAPRSSRSSSNRSSDAPQWTTKQIEAFYERVRQGAFIGKEAEKDRIEQSLINATNAGRVVRNS